MTHTRKTLPKRKSAVRKVNRKRRSANWLRAYGSEERVGWVKAQPCVTDNPSWSRCVGEVENAHIETGGTGRKADAAKVVPLCRRHHRCLHEQGRETFETLQDVDLEILAARTERRWLAAGGSPQTDTET